MSGKSTPRRVSFSEKTKPPPDKAKRKSTDWPSLRCVSIPDDRAMYRRESPPYRKIHPSVYVEEDGGQIFHPQQQIHQNVVQDARQYPQRPSAPLGFYPNLSPSPPPPPSPPQPPAPPPSPANKEQDRILKEQAAQKSFEQHKETRQRRHTIKNEYSKAEMYDDNLDVAFFRILYTAECGRGPYPWHGNWVEEFEEFRQYFHRELERVREQEYEDWLEYGSDCAGRDSP